MNNDVHFKTVVTIVSPFPLLNALHFILEDVISPENVLYSISACIVYLSISIAIISHSYKLCHNAEQLASSYYPRRETTLEMLKPLVLA